MVRPGGPLNMLAALDPLPSALSGRRADVMVERRGKARPTRLTHDLGAFRVIAAHHLLVIEEIEVLPGQRTSLHLEAVRGQRTGWSRRQGPRIDDRHSSFLQVDAFPRCVTAIAVAASQDLAVAVERGFSRIGHVVEQTGPNCRHLSVSHRCHDCRLSSCNMVEHSRPAGAGVALSAAAVSGAPPQPKWTAMAVQWQPEGHAYGTLCRSHHGELPQSSRWSKAVGFRLHA